MTKNTPNKHDCQSKWQKTGGKNNNTATTNPKKRWLNLEKIQKLKTCWFQLDESIFAHADKIDSHFSGLESVFSYGPQIFDKIFNGQATTCYCYSVTFDTENVNFKKDLQRAESVKFDNLTLHQCELDNEGHPVLQPITGLEFSFSAKLLDEGFLRIVSSIKTEFKKFAEFQEVDKSIIFIDDELAKLRIQVRNILMRPRGRYDLKLESGRRFSLIARSFGVAPKGKPAPVSSQKKSCYQCGSNQHLASDCNKNLEKNKIDTSKTVSSTPAKSTTNRRSGRITRKPDRYGIEKPRSNNDKSIFFDDESKIDLPQPSSELQNTRELLESTDDESDDTEELINKYNNTRCDSWDKICQKNNENVRKIIQEMPIDSIACIIESKKILDPRSMFRPKLESKQNLELYNYRTYDDQSWTEIDDSRPFLITTNMKEVLEYAVNNCSEHEVEILKNAEDYYVQLKDFC